VRPNDQIRVHRVGRLGAKHPVSVRKLQRIAARGAEIKKCAPGPRPKDDER
jgi:hypothetical protein